MTKWKLPPKAKIYEALSAFADGRVTITSETTAKVLSSSRGKTYDVEWSSDMRQITSNDNASYWQGYIGYPIVAVLLALKKIDFDASIARSLAGLPWNEINAQFKRDYDRAVEYALEGAAGKGEDREKIVQEVERIFKELAGLELHRLRQRKAPPDTK